MVTKPKTQPNDVDATETPARVERWVRPQIRALSAYHVPEPADVIKLDAMENPYSWPEDVAAAWLERLRTVELNRYPDAGAGELKARLREFMRLPADMDLILGNGSDELIQLVQMAVAGPGRTVLAPVPTFVMYRMIATFLGLEFVGVPLRADFSLDPDAMLDAIRKVKPAVVFLAYPNNPTGNLFDPDVVDAIIRASDGLVVVDEAYFAFSEASYLPRLGEFPNLLVMQTVSKLGLAGLRLGMLAGPRPWLAQVDKLRLPYNINSLTQASAAFALEHRAMLEDQAARICSERARLAIALAALDGVETFPSRANFILFRVAEPERIYMRLYHRGVLIKNLHQADTALAGCLRVTVGQPGENDAFLGALAAALVQAR